MVKTMMIKVMIIMQLIKIYSDKNEINKNSESNEWIVENHSTKFNGAFASHSTVCRHWKQRRSCICCADQKTWVSFVKGTETALFFVIIAISATVVK